MFARAMDVLELHPYWSMAQALYTTNFTFIGLGNVVSIMAFGYFYWFIGRDPTKKPAIRSDR